MKDRQIRRHELTDEEWKLLEPARETRGRYFHDYHAVLNGMRYWMHTGALWRELPSRWWSAPSSACTHGWMRDSTPSST
ncbi:MAG: transposase [Gemmatimonadaceae bacterium]